MTCFKVNAKRKHYIAERKLLHVPIVLYLCNTSEANICPNLSTSTCEKHCQRVSLSCDTTVKTEKQDGFFKFKHAGFRARIIRSRLFGPKSRLFGPKSRLFRPKRRYFSWKGTFSLLKVSVRFWPHGPRRTNLKSSLYELASPEVSTMIKKKRKFSSYIRKFRWELLQSHI